jgi:hypothetical protein
MFADKGFPSVPSADDPYPVSGQPYFNGGYNTIRHGSKTSGTIDGIQIECNQNVRFTEPARVNFANNVAVVFLDYLKKHYFPNLPLTYCTVVGIENSPTSHFHIFPNPFRNVLCFQNTIPTDIKIFDFQGKLVYSGRIEPEEKINLSYLLNGLYLVIISNGGKIKHSEKIIKED